MGKKIRLIRTMVMEYTPEEDNYPKGATIEEMAQIDAELDDRDLTFSGICQVDEVKWEIVD